MVNSCIDGLEPLGAQTSTDTVMTKFESRMCGTDARRAYCNSSNMKRYITCIKITILVRLIIFKFKKNRNSFTEDTTKSLVVAQRNEVATKCILFIWNKKSIHSITKSGDKCAHSVSKLPTFRNLCIPSTHLYHKHKQLCVLKNVTECLIILFWFGTIIWFCTQNVRLPPMVPGLIQYYSHNSSNLVLNWLNRKFSICQTKYTV